MGRKRDGYVDIWSSSNKGRCKNPKKCKKQNSYKYQNISSENELWSSSGMGKTKKTHKIRTTLLTIFSIVLMVSVTLVTAGYFYIGSALNTVDFPTDAIELGIDSSIKSSMFVKNIALFGVDSREGEDQGRSDTIIVISLDILSGQVKLISILRDSRVNIPGYGKDKLCHAYAYGGPELAVKTINQNYGLDIKEYITVNFDQLARIIDVIGGVTINITERERIAANGLIASTPSLSYSPGIKSSGTVYLNGAQAVAYSRIRKIDNESQRASRQQTVLQAMIDQVSTMSIFEYPKMVKEILPYMETSLSYGDLLTFVPIIIGGMPEMENKTVPDQNDPNVDSGEINGVWYWTYDLDDAANDIYQFIYE